MLDCLAEATDPTLPLHAAGPETLASVLESLPAAQAAFIRASGFEGARGQSVLLPGTDGLAGALVGLGAEGGPWAYGGLPMALPAGTAWRLEGVQDGAAAALGWCLGAYRYARLKPAPRRPARLVARAGSDAAIASAEAAWRVRDLINTPANLLGPAELAAAARGVAERTGAQFDVIEGAALAEGFPLVAAVGGGSARPPCVAAIRWDSGVPGAPLVALCGKGVCFDTGGLDLKPAAGMLRMKKDMGGAAVVLGTAELLMRERLPIRLLVLVGAVENAVSGTAFRPLDVIRSRKGLTVEIGNTDAEGRLVLADLLAYAAEQSPALIVDCATLTGAARVALGPDLPALFATDDGAAEAILAAGQSCNDPLWRLPLQSSYDSWLDSSVADLSNVATKPMAGAVVAALFLKRFLPAAQPWVHLDLYAWNDSSRPGRPEGGEAQGMRALHGGISALVTGGALTGTVTKLR
jgi:leucyl aminopeptidase